MPCEEEDPEQEPAMIGGTLAWGGPITALRIIISGIVASSCGRSNGGAAQRSQNRVGAKKTLRRFCSVTVACPVERTSPSEARDEETKPTFFSQRCDVSTVRVEEGCITVSARRSERRDEESPDPPVHVLLRGKSAREKTRENGRAISSTV